MGPEGGDAGGTVVAYGTPEKVCEVEGSYTGRYLRPILERDRKRQALLASAKALADDDSSAGADDPDDSSDSEGRGL